VETHTGIDMIIVAKGEDRRFHLSPGANLELDVKHVLKILKKYKPRIYNIRPGYSGIDDQLADIISRLNGTLVFLDICRPFRRPGIEGWTYIQPALGYVDILHCNEVEAMHVTGKENVKDAIKELFNLGVKSLLITGGEKGARFIAEEFEIFQPAYKVNQLDPTGCGDAFIAGWDYQMLKRNVKDVVKLDQEEIVDMLAFAQACGAACVEHVGCTTGVTKENVTRIYARKEEILKVQN
jgi:sugar/nucleoside kinase (ribokinase family)